MLKDLGVGSKVRHPKHGEGIVSEAGMSSAKIIFKAGGEKEYSLDSEVFEELEKVERDENALSMEDVEQALAAVLQKFADFTPTVELADKWRGGRVLIQPGNDSLADKEIPIDTLFHKIVMVRERLRVLEQNLNKSKNLADDEKIHMQQYITRIYGSLTTFNVLFKNKEDHFVGERSRES